jgi:hypothetical protein
MFYDAKHGLLHRNMPPFRLRFAAVGKPHGHPLNINKQASK